MIELVWTGMALGADAEIHIAGLDQGAAARLIERATAEISRLEAIFSLYRPDSELSHLNETGVLQNPSQDFRLLLERSLQLHRLTGGAFNVAIQPVWALIARHFAESLTPPPIGAISRALLNCDPSRLTITPAQIALRPGMALTFNGIAQGYITDAVAELFRQEGLRDILIALGETRALAGRSWEIEIAGRRERVALSDGAVAQSAGRGTTFTADGTWHHLIDPRLGISPNRLTSVTVKAATATEADALSTALYVASPEIQNLIVERFPDAEMYFGDDPA
jgi:thiamine biosynthesis lipoprotein